MNTPAATFQKKYYKAIGIIAMLWNLMGIMTYLIQLGFDKATIAAKPKMEQELYSNIPTWYTIIFGIAVFSGFLGSILLLLKKKLSTSLFMISFLAVLAQMYYNFFVAQTIAVFGLKSIIIPSFVVIISFALLWYSRKMDELAILS